MCIAESFKRLIAGCANTDMQNQVLRLICDVLKKDSEYFLLLHHCAANNNWVAARQLFQAMLKKGLIPDAKKFEALIENCSDNGDFVEFLKSRCTVMFAQVHAFLYVLACNQIQIIHC